MVIRLLLLECKVSSVFENNLFCNSNENVKKKTYIINRWKPIENPGKTRGGGTSFWSLVRRRTIPGLSSSATQAS